MRSFHAPGRVNLIGDHIDYMGGTVLPMAIDRGTTIAADARADRRIVATSTNFPEVGLITCDMDATQPDPDWSWANYLVAVVCALQRAGHQVPHGFDVTVSGTIPNGAGLSSSASLELAFAVAINEMAGLALTATELAILCQAAENSFIGVACGIMDQLAIAEGVAGHALLMDCAAMTVAPVPFPADVGIVIANTKQRRELSTSAYNERRSACERAEGLLGWRLVQIPADEMAGVLDTLPADVVRRARHVITEQHRVEAFAAALRRDDRVSLGSLMRGSHESLRDDFDVTGPALDALAEAAWAHPGTIGARMTGAGFGGCTVNLVEPEVVPDFIAAVGADYTAATGQVADFYVVGSADGAREIT